MAKILLSETSLRDLDDIYDYVNESSPQNAEQLVAQFKTRFQTLSDHPEIGRPRTELLEHLRCWNLHRYVIFYFAQADGIEVIRVLHSAMDISSSHFKTPPTA